MMKDFGSAAGHAYLDHFTMAAPSEMVQEVVLEDKIVEIWPDYPCLYDIRSPDFKNRDKRDNALKEIADKLQTSIDWVKNKLRNLRNSYTKAKKPQSSGSARKSNTKRSSWLLEKLQFLEPYVKTRPSISTLDPLSPSMSVDDELDYNVEDVDDESNLSMTSTESLKTTCSTESRRSPVPSSSTKLPIKEKVKPTRKRQADDEYEIIKGLAQSIANRGNKKDTKPEQASPAASFGRYVAESLSELEPKMRHLAQHKISEIILQAQMGTLSHFQNMPPRLAYHQFDTQQQHFSLTLNQGNQGNLSCDSQFDTPVTNWLM